MAGGGLRAQDLVIGTLRMDVLPNHVIEEQQLGKEGPFLSQQADWFEGLLTAAEGIRTIEGGGRKFVSSRGVDTAFPQQVVVQPQAAKVIPTTWSQGPTKFVDFGGRTYTSSGTDVWRSGVGDLTSWTSVYTAAATITDIIIWGGAILVAYTSGYARSVTGAAASWTAVGTAALYFAALGKQLWRVEYPNLVYYNTVAIATPAWSSSTSIGDSSAAINSIVGVEQILLVGKEDGIYTLDEDGNSQALSPELRNAPSANNSTTFASLAFNGDYYTRTKLGLLKIDGLGGAKEMVGFDELASPDLPTTPIKALAQDGHYLYAMCDTSSGGANLRNVTILRRTIQGAWHPFYVHDSLGSSAGSGRPGVLGVTGIMGYAQLLFSYLTNDTGPVWALGIITLSKFANPLQDTTYTYDTDIATKWVRLPRIFSPWGKLTIDRIQVLGRQLTANHYLQVFVSTDGAAAAQFGGNVVSGTVNALTPAAAITGNYFDVYVYFVNDATSPVLEGVTVQGFWRSNKRFKHTYAIIGDTYHEPRRGGAVRMPPEQLITQLDALRETDTFSNCEDEYGVAFKALVTGVVRTTTKNVQAEDGGMMSSSFQVVIEEQATT